MDDFTPRDSWRTDQFLFCFSGIGKFTIADEAMVSDSDLGVNFFLDEGSRGRSRAECCTELLLELNPEVEGQWWPEANVRPMAPYPRV